MDTSHSSRDGKGLGRVVSSSQASNISGGWVSAPGSGAGRLFTLLKSSLISTLRTRVSKCLRVSALPRGSMRG